MNGALESLLFQLIRFRDIKYRSVIYNLNLSHISSKFVPQNQNSKSHTSIIAIALKYGFIFTIVGKDSFGTTQISESWLFSKFSYRKQYSVLAPVFLIKHMTVKKSQHFEYEFYLS